MIRRPPRSTPFPTRRSSDLRGEVALAIKVIETTPRGTHVRCEVRDTGIGIPADRHNALFIPFTQVDTSTTRMYGRSEEHTSELQSPDHLVCRLLLEKKKKHD